jgi:hypothetical protein
MLNIDQLRMPSNINSSPSTSEFAICKLQKLVFMHKIMAWKWQKKKKEKEKKKERRFAGILSIPSNIKSTSEFAICTTQKN